LGDLDYAFQLKDKIISIGGECDDPGRQGRDLLFCGLEKAISPLGTAALDTRTCRGNGGATIQQQLIALTPHL